MPRCRLAAKNYWNWHWKIRTAITLVLARRCAVKTGSSCQFLQQIIRAYILLVLQAHGGHDSLKSRTSFTYLLCWPKFYSWWFKKHLQLEIVSSTGGTGRIAVLWSGDIWHKQGRYTAIVRRYCKLTEVDTSISVNEKLFLEILKFGIVCQLI